MPMLTLIRRRISAAPDDYAHAVLWDLLDEFFQTEPGTHP